MEKAQTNLVIGLIIVALIVLAVLIFVLSVPEIFTDKHDGEESTTQVIIIQDKEKEPEWQTYENPYYREHIRKDLYYYDDYSDWKKEEDNRCIVYIRNKGYGKYFTVKFYLDDGDDERIKRQTEYVSRGEREKFSVSKGEDEDCDYVVKRGRLRYRDDSDGERYWYWRGWKY